MALDKKDKEDIGEIVETKISGLETKVTKEFGLLRLEMNQRFDQTDQKIDSVEGNILDKIEEIKKMETEDIQALSGDITAIKKKIALSIYGLDKL